jgi:hypothetical protein
MQRELTPYTHIVEFASGSPTGAFSYTITDDDGNVVAGLENVVVSIGIGAISARIDVPAAYNTVSKPLFETRTITWTYPTNSGTVNGSQSYVIYKQIPFPATPEGVRQLLGVTEKEVPDENIDLMSGYLRFREPFDDPDAALLPYTTSGDASSYKITRAIEAAAALQILPTLQLALAKRFDSGTNAYERWNRIDWEGLAGRLMSLVQEAVVLVDPLLELDFPILFVLSTRTDPLTGV